MVALSRTSETLILVRRARPVLDPEETITQVLRPSTLKLLRPSSQAHRPPKARVSDEADLPSIIVAEDRWVSPEPTQLMPTQVMKRVRALAAAPRPVARTRGRRQSDWVQPTVVQVSPRRYNLSLAFIAIGLALACLYVAPLLGRLMETAFVALNR